MHMETLAHTCSNYGDTAPVSLRLRRWIARRDQRLGKLDGAERWWKESLEFADQAVRVRCQALGT